MGGYAWVTLATNDSYSLGALVLAHSLKQVGTKQQLAVLITPGVTGPMRTKLNEVFNLVKEVNILDSRDETNLRLLKRPELGVTFTKLHCWRLTQFEKCVFLDADTLVLENCDELFDREEFSAAPDIGWPDCFNSGVFVYHPSNDTYDKLIQFAIEKGSFDGGDQGLLNLYFSDWAHKDISKHLPFIYNMSSTATYSYLPAFKQFGGNVKIIHFIGATKPWLQYFDTESKRVHPSDDVKHLQEILQRWWNIFCSMIHPNLSPDMNIPSPTHTVHGSQSYHPENITHTSYYYQHDSDQIPSSSNPSESYQHVWDPWEEYDSRQINAQAEQTSETFHPHEIVCHSQHEVPHNFIPSEDIHYHSHHIENPSYIHHSETHRHIQEHHDPCSNFDDHHGPHVHIQYNDDHNNYVHEHHDPPQSQHIERNEHIESHNANAHFDTHHDHCIIDPIHTHSQPKSQTITYHEPPHTPIQKTQEIKPPPPPPSPDKPRLPDECVGTTTVSNEINLHTSSNEDKCENDTGIAGAFAKLTLGVPRTPEQAALDDHLRRQGWEVGNIDYLGRDSFDNIWSKICETLSSTTESAPKPEESSPAESTEKVTKEPTTVQPEKEVPAEPQKESTPETLETSISAPSSVEAITAPVTPCAVSEAVIAPTAALLTSEPEKPPISNLETAPLPRPVSTPASQSDTAKIAADDVLISPSSIPGPTLATPVPEITPEKATDSVPVSTTPPSVVPIETQSAAVVPTSVSETTIAQPITPSPAFTETKTPTPKQESSIPSSAPLIPAPTSVSKNTASETEAKTFTSESSTGVPIPISTTVTTAQLIPDPESTAPSDSLKSGEIPSSGPTAPSTVDLTSAVLKDTVPLDVKPQTAITPQVTETPKESQSIACSLPSVGPNSPKESPACPLSKESPVCTLPPKDIAACPLPSKDSPTCPLPPKEVPVSPPPSKEDPVCPLPKALAVAPSGKKSKESVTLPKALVTEPTPPATPSSPQPKQVQQVLSGEQATTDTVSEASVTGPTPPPRKSSGGTKKVASKKK